MPTLIIEKAGVEELGGTVFDLAEDTSPAVIGRKEPATIAIRDPRASRRHARIVLRYGTWILEDLESRNGLYLRDGDRGWKRIARRRLVDGDLLRIGSTVIRFESRAREIPLDGKETRGCRLDRLIAGEAGMAGFLAWQLAMDRPVRVDIGTVPEEGRDELLAALEVAASAASRIEHPSIGVLLQKDVDDGGRVTLLFRIPDGVSFHGDAAALLAQPIGVRLRCFRLLADAVLAQGRERDLSYPIGLRHVGWNADLEPWIPALELSTWLIDRRRHVAHFPSLIPYAPPEKLSGKVAKVVGDVALASRVYNLGAIGYHLVTGALPMGDGDGEETIKNHLKLAPTPADVLRPEVPAAVSQLLERMLAKKPSDRPADAVEITGTLAESAPADARPQTPAGPEEGSLEWEPIDTGSIDPPIDPPIDARSIDAGPAEPRPARAPRKNAAGRRPSRDRSIEVDADEARPTSLAVLLPIWIVLWVGIFVATKILTELVLEQMARQ